MKGQSWSIVIFCYNEEGSIGYVVQKAYEILNVISSEENEILIVNDGSTDKTSEIINNLKKKYSCIRIINHSVNLGIGEALRTGYFNAKYENVCSVPADGQFDLNELLPFAEIHMKEFISFRRTKKPAYSSYRTFLSFMNRMLNQHFLQLRMHDVNWVKIIKLEELRKLDLRMHSSLIETEICSKLVTTSNKMIEVPSYYHQRIAGKVKGSSIREVIKISKEFYKLMIIAKQFKKKYLLTNKA